MSLRAVAYARYSSDNQREESIDAQIRAIDAYCKSKGYVLSEVAKTGKNDHREGFQQMVTDAEQKKFDVLIIHKINRFARNRYDSAIYRRKLKLLGIRAESVVEQLDDSPESVILESVLEGLAEYHSLDLARETRKRLLENALKGVHTGGRPAYGCKINPDTKKLGIDERTAPAVRFYFEAISKGVPIRQIAEKLINERGFRTYNNRPYMKNSFRDWHANKKYVGIFTWDVREAQNPDGTWNNHRRKSDEDQVQVEGVVPALIEKSLWDEENRILASRKRNPNVGKRKTN